MNSSDKNNVFSLHYPFIALLIILSWTSFEYGARYLQAQVIGQILTAGTILLLVISFYKQKWTLPLYGLTIQSFIFMAVIFLSFFTSVNKLASLEEILRYMMYLLLPVIVLCWATTYKRIQALIYAIIGIGLLICLSSIIPFIMASLMSVGDIALDSSFARTNDLGGFLLLVFPLPLGMFLVLKDIKHKIAMAVIFSIIFMTLVFTNSRGVWLSSLLAVIFMFVIFRPQKFKIKENLKYIIPGAVIIIGLLSVNFAHFYNRFTNTIFAMTTDNSFLWRQSLLKGAWKIFIDNPLLGTGINTFSSVYGAYQDRAGYFSINPHNYYLQLLSETGILGLISFLILIISIFYVSYLNIKKSKDHPQIYYLIGATTACLLGSAIHIAFDIEWSVSSIPILFWIEVGIIFVSQKYINFLREEYDYGKRKILISPNLVLLSLSLLLLILPVMNLFSANFYLKGFGEFQKNNFEQSKIHLLNAIRLSPYPSAKHYGLLALTQTYKNELDDAQKNALKAITLDHYNDKYYITMANILIKKGRKNECQAFFEKAISLNPYKYPHLYTNIADYLNSMNKKDEALNWLQKGAVAFQAKDLPSYEFYNPGHRYELFNLYKKMSQLFKDSDDKKAYALANEKADYILANEPKLDKTSAKLSAPVNTVTYYWQSIDAIREGKLLSPAPAVEKLFIPRKEFKFDSLEFIELEKDLESSKIKYKLSLKKDNIIKSYYLTDYLVLSADGWQIFGRR